MILQSQNPIIFNLALLIVTASMELGSEAEDEAQDDQESEDETQDDWPEDHT